MLDLQVHTDEGSIIIARLAGELTGVQVPELNDALRGAATGPAARLAIDLSGLTLLDSSGLSALIDLTNRARLTNGKVVLIDPSPFVAGVFRATRLDGWFDLAKDLAGARQALAES